MNLQKKYIILFIILSFLFITICKNKEHLSLAGRKLLCDYKLIDHQHEIIPRLWLGDYESSQDMDFLKKNNIKLIINLSKTLDFNDDPNIHKYRIPIHDNRSKESNLNLINQFDEAYKTIFNELRCLSP